MQDSLTAGLLGHAKRWSLVGLVAGLGLAFVLGALNVAYLIANSITSEQYVIVSPVTMHSWTLAGLVVLIVCSFGTQLVVRVMMQQRRARWEVEDLRDEVVHLQEQVSGMGTILAVATSPRPEPPQPRRRPVEGSDPDVFQLPSPGTVAAVRRLAAKVIDKR